MLRKLLFPEKVNILRRAYIWNLIASGAFAAQSALFLLVITRTGGETEAGSFIILFTVAQTLYSLGCYNMRDYQVSDLKGDYPFSTYYTARILSCGAMILAAAGYAIWKQLPAERMIVLGSLICYRGVECFEDLYHGAVQRVGRFDASSLCMAIRILLSSAVFCTVYAITKNQVAASVAFLATAGCAFAITNAVLRKEFSVGPGWRTAGVWRLLAACFPMCVSGFMNSYLITAPKYAIDDLMSGSAQTVFNVLLMPIFLINLLSLFIYKPMIVKVSEAWNEGRIGDFRKMMARQGLMIAGLTAGVAIAGYVIGLKLLEMIYGIPLGEYKILFTILLLFGGAGALAFYLNAMITVMRKQKYILMGYGLAFGVSLVTTRPMVQSGGIAGAGYAYGLIMGTLLVFYLAVVAAETAREKRRIKGERGTTDAH